MMNKIDIKQGDKFGKWTVIKEAEKKLGKMHYHVRCECGKEAVAQGTNLHLGRTTQCLLCSRRIAKQRMKNMARSL